MSGCRHQKHHVLKANPSIKNPARHNGFRANPRPNSNTTPYQGGRQLRAVELMRVSRATARSSRGISAGKAAGFSPELGGAAITVANPRTRDPIDHSANDLLRCRYGVASFLWP